MKWTLYNKATGEFGPIISGSEAALSAHLSEEIGAKEGAWKRGHRVVGDEIVPNDPPGD